jgi:hypothetical protein
MSDIDWLSVLVYIIDPDSPDEPELFMTLSGGRHMSKQKTGLERGKKYILTVTADAPGVEGLHCLHLFYRLGYSMCKADSVLNHYYILTAGLNLPVSLCTDIALIFFRDLLFDCCCK